MCHCPLCRSGHCRPERSWKGGAIGCFPEAVVTPSVLDEIPPLPGQPTQCLRRVGVPQGTGAAANPYPLSTLVLSTTAARAPGSRQNAQLTELNKATYDAHRSCTEASQTRRNGNCYPHHRRRRRVTFPHRCSVQSVTSGIAVDGRRMQRCWKCGLSGLLLGPRHLYRRWRLVCPDLSAHEVASRPPTDGS
jgi:hypothetical protein